MTERNPLPDCLSHLAQLRAEPSEEAVRDALIALQDRIGTRLNNCLCCLGPGEDDSITGFNMAWDIVRTAFDEALR